MKLNGLEAYFKTVNGEIVDFKQLNEFIKTPLIYSFYYNKKRNLNLSHKQFDYLIKNSDLKHNDTLGWTPLMYAFRWNEEENLNLSHKQFDYLIQNSELKQVSNNGLSALMYAFRFNEGQNLNLTKEQFDYLVKNSNLNQVSIYNESPLRYALKYNQEKNLSKENLKNLIGQSDMSLIKEEKLLIELKKIYSELLNDEILSKIDIKETKNKNNKI